MTQRQCRSGYVPSHPLPYPSPLLLWPCPPSPGLQVHCTHLVGARREARGLDTGGCTGGRSCPPPSAGAPPSVSWWCRKEAAWRHQWGPGLRSCAPAEIAITWVRPCLEPQEPPPPKVPELSLTLPCLHSIFITPWRLPLLTLSLLHGQSNGGHKRLTAFPTTKQSTQ